MKNKFRNGKSLFMLMAVCAFILCLPRQVYAATVNEYHQTDYSASKEDAQKFEQILRDEGYVCVTKGCTDNAEWTEALLNESYITSTLGGYLTDSGEDYRLFISPFDYKHCMVDKDANISTLLSECYIVDYYIFNHNEEGAHMGLIDNEAVNAGYSTGWLTIYLNVDDDLKAKPNLTYNIILFGKGAQMYYDLSTSDADANDYVIRHRLPEDAYTVYSVIADTSHEADFSANKNGADFRVQADMNRDFYISFNKLDVDESLASGSKQTFNPASDNTAEVVVMPDGTEVKMDKSAAAKKEQDAQKKTRNAIGGIIYIVLFVVAGAIILAIYKKIQSREDEIS